MKAPDLEPTANETTNPLWDVVHTWDREKLHELCQQTWKRIEERHPDGLIPGGELIEAFYCGILAAVYLQKAAKE